MRPNIKEVAKDANVSVATVSRYLNNSPLISEKSASKVKHSMDKLNYEPSYIARSLVNQKSNIIAFVIDSNNRETFGNDYFLKIQYGIEDTLGKYGYYLMIISTTNTPAGEKSMYKLVLENRVDGIIMPAEIVRKNFVKFLNEHDFPFIIFGKTSITNTNWLDIDNVQAGRVATEKLLKSGAGKIGFITNNFKKVFAAERYEGYQEAILKASLAINKSDIFEGYYSSEDGSKLMEQLLEGNHCDAYVVTDNVIAFGMLKYMKEHNILVPDDIQIVSFDNTIVSELSDSPMSVINIDVMRLGQQAAAMMLSQLNAPSNIYQHSLVPIELIERKTTK